MENTFEKKKWQLTFHKQRRHQNPGFLWRTMISAGKNNETNQSRLVSFELSKNWLVQLQYCQTVERVGYKITLLFQIYPGWMVMRSKRIQWFYTDRYRSSQDQEREQSYFFVKSVCHGLVYLFNIFIFLYTKLDLSLFFVLLSLHRWVYIL